MEAIIDVYPTKDGAAIWVKAAEGSWVKKYRSMPAATNEAVELGMLIPDEKKILDRGQPMPGYPKALQAKRDLRAQDLSAAGYRPVDVNTHYKGCILDPKANELADGSGWTAEIYIAGPDRGDIVDTQYFIEEKCPRREIAVYTALEAGKRLIDNEG